MVPGAGRGDAGGTGACGRQGAKRPGAGRGEEPEVAGGRRDHLGGELVRRVEQADERATDGLARALADAAVRDGLLLAVQTRVGVELGEVVVRLECAVLVGRLAPRDVDRAGDMP